VANKLSLSFEVNDFDANRKPVCDFLLVNNTSLRPTSHRFPVIVLSQSNYRLVNALVLSNLCENRHSS